jgi:hypothetical protein
MTLILCILSYYAPTGYTHKIKVMKTYGQFTYTSITYSVFIWVLECRGEGLFVPRCRLTNFGHTYIMNLSKYVDALFFLQIMVVQCTIVTLS